MIYQVKDKKSNNIIELDVSDKTLWNACIDFLSDLSVDFVNGISSIGPVSYEGNMVTLSIVGSGAEGKRTILFTEVPLEDLKKEF